MKTARKGRVLVVDDYENWRFLLKSLLEGDGHIVLTAPSHHEAEEALSTNAFDVVVLDMRLVDDEKYNVQGLDLLRQIKTQASFTGAVILTGYPDSAHRERALNLYGADAYLSKAPDDEDIGDFDIEGFSSLIAELIAKSEKARA